jgi:methylmalonyl-CoA epimerase
LDHVGIAVNDLDAGARFWQILGLSQSGQDEANEEQGVNIRFIGTSAGEPPKLELLEPTGEDTPIGRFIAKRGEGVQQLAFEVDDLESLLVELADAGVSLINETPQSGADGTRIAFVHPKSTGGVLVELLERV